MGKIKIDTNTWREARFARLCQAMRWERPMALGVLTLFWHATRRDDIVSAPERALMEYLPCDTAVRLDLLRALESEQYVRRQDNGDYVVEGNDLHRALTHRLAAAGRIGQQVTMERLRGKALVREVAAAEPEQSQQRRQASLFPEGETDRDVAEQLWLVYEAAHCDRYEALPRRNDLQMNVLTFFVQRTGKDARVLLDYFMAQDDPEYRRSGHNLSLAVRDADKLRRRWMAGLPKFAQGQPAAALSRCAQM